MDSKTKETIERCADASHAGAITFGELVTALSEHGVESYGVDFRLRSTHYFLPSGETHAMTLKTPIATIWRCLQCGCAVGRDPWRSAWRGEIPGVRRALDGSRLRRLCRLDRR